MHEEKLDRLISQTYACALGQQPWSGLGATLAGSLNSPSAVLRQALAAPGTGVLFDTPNFHHQGFEPAEVQHWFEHDLWAERAAQVGIGQMVHTRRLMDDHTLERSGFYHDWLRRLGIHHGLGCVFEHPSWGPLVLGVHRDRSGADFGPQDENLLQRWLPHLQRALGMVQAASPSMPGCAPQDALFLLDAECHVIWCNEAAHHWARQAHWLVLCSERPSRGAKLRLLAPLHTALPWLREHLKRLRHKEFSQSSPLPDFWYGQPQAADAAGADWQPLLMRAKRLLWPEHHHGGLAGASEAAEARLLLMLRTPMARQIDAALLADLYRLTGAELRVLERLCLGQEPSFIAQAHGVQVNTVQAQIKALLQKTGTKRQAQLLALALRTALLT